MAAGSQLVEGLLDNRQHPSQVSCSHQSSERHQNQHALGLRLEGLGFS